MIYILFGQNIGTCVTAMLASIGTNRAGKRAAMIHLMFNVIGTLVFIPICLFLPYVELIEGLTADPKLQISFAHIGFNIGGYSAASPLCEAVGPPGGKAGARQGRRI